MASHDEVAIFMLNDQKLAESKARVYKGALIRNLELLASAEPDMEIHKTEVTRSEIQWNSNPIWSWRRASTATAFSTKGSDSLAMSGLYMRK